MPVAQLPQIVAGLLSSSTVPAAQSMQASVPAAAYLPAAQASQPTLAAVTARRAVISDMCSLQVWRAWSGLTSDFAGSTIRAGRGCVAVFVHRARCAIDAGVRARCRILANDAALAAVGAVRSAVRPGGGSDGAGSAIRAARRRVAVFVHLARGARRARPGPRVVVALVALPQALVRRAVVRQPERQVAVPGCARRHPAVDRRRARHRARGIRDRRARCAALHHALRI